MGLLRQLDLSGYSSLVKHSRDGQYQEMAAAVLGIAFAVVGLTSLMFGCMGGTGIGRYTGKRGGGETCSGNVIRIYFFILLGKIICLIFI